MINEHFEIEILSYIKNVIYKEHEFLSDLNSDLILYEKLLEKINYQNIQFFQNILQGTDYYRYVETHEKAKLLAFSISINLSEYITRYTSIRDHSEKHSRIKTSIKNTPAFDAYCNYWIKCITDNPDEWLHIGAKSIVDSFHKLINNKNIDIIDENVNKTIYRYLCDHKIDEIKLKLRNENSLQYLKDEIIAKLFIPVSMSMVNYKVHYSDDIWEQSSFEIINTIKTLVNANKIPTTDKNIDNVILKVLKEYSLDDLRDLIKDEDTFYILAENEFAKKLIPIAIHLQSNVIIKQAV